MFATGRSPNVKNLGLEKVGVELDAHGAIKARDATDPDDCFPYNWPHDLT